VVVLIGVFAAMAIPQVTRQMRDRRTHETAQRIALVYQQARVRAMGQGGAILVHYGQGSGNGSFETLEALVGTADSKDCALIPSTSCTQTQWASATAGQARSIELIDLYKEPYLDGNVFATLTPDTTTAAGTTMDVCFTPLGRAFVRYAASDPWTPLRGVPQLNVFRGTNASTPVGLTRRVLVLPTGIARLQL
jgi:type IV fimbrial biogenesis protein FimT